MAGQGRPRPVFQLCDAVPSGPQREVLGLWAPVPGSSSEAQSFGAPAPMTGVEPVWLADYPADLVLTEQALGEAQQTLAKADAALTIAPARLDDYVAGGLVGVAFGLPDPDTPLAEPEGELTLLLGEIRGNEIRGREIRRHDLVASYDLGAPLAGRWDRALQAYQEFTDRLQAMVGHLARVETRVGGQLVGRTFVSWTGDVDTRLLDRLDPDTMRLHQQTLDLALASRMTMLRTSSLVIANSVKLAVLLATPGGIALALPVVLRFVHLIRKEFNSGTVSSQ